MERTNDIGRDEINRHLTVFESNRQHRLYEKLSISCYHLHIIVHGTREKPFRILQFVKFYVANFVWYGTGISSNVYLNIFRLACVLSLYKSFRFDLRRNIKVHKSN